MKDRDSWKEDCIRCVMKEELSTIQLWGEKNLRELGRAAFKYPRGREST